MIKNGSAPGLPAIRVTIQFLNRFKWFFCVGLAVLLTVAATPAPDEQNPDEQYIHIMTLIDRADKLRSQGKADAAKARYKEAQAELIRFKNSNPLWSPKIVTYRINELTDRIEVKPASPDTTAPVKKPQPKLEAEPSGSKSGVKLLDPGAEPRKVLRLHVKAGDKQTAILTLKMNMSMEMPGAPGAGQPMKIPAISIPLDITVQSVAANGDISYQSVMGEAGIVDEPGANPQMVEGMKKALSGIKGLTSTGVMSDRGISKKVDVKAPPSSDPQTRQMMDQMRDSLSNMDAPMPDEAVGAGAKWEFKKPIHSQGISLEQTADYQLVSVDGDHVTTSFTVNQSAANQKIQSPAAGGAQVNLIQMTADAKGTRTADLSKFAATQVNLDLHMDMKSEITAAGKTQPMAMKMDMNFGMEAQ